MWVEDDELAELDEQHDEPGIRRDAPDGISQGVGSDGYLERYTLEDCTEPIPNSTLARFPETFDRFYFAAQPPVLIDVLDDSNADALRADRARKRVEFKERWCAENDRRYLPLCESDASAEQIRQLLADGPGTHPAPRVSRPAAAAQRKSGIQRPKAAAQ